MRRWLIFITVVFLVCAIPSGGGAKVYVYEVITAQTTFQTASKLQPDAFFYYNGGEDIIISLKVLDVYPDDNFTQALRDYGLENKNVRYLPHLDVPKDNITRRPYYWWR